MGSADHSGSQICRRKFVFSIPARELSKRNQPEAIRFTMFRFSMSLVRRIVRGISSHVVNEFLFFFGVGGSGRSPLECASMEMEAWGTRAAVSWCRALVPLVPSLVLSLLLVPGLVPGSIVSSVIAALAPLRHASNLCGPFNLCSLLSAVSLPHLKGPLQMIPLAGTP